MAKQELKNPYLVDLLAHQAETACAESTLKAIQAAIAEQESALAGCAPPAGNIPEMENRLQELLAEKALGVDVSTELSALEAGLDEAVADHRKHSEKSAPLIQAARHALAGLRRKLAVAQEDYDRLKTDGIDKMQSFLRSEAERIGTEYLTTGKELAKKHSELLALDSLLKRFGGKGLFNNYTSAAAAPVPLFNLDVHQGCDHANQRGFLAESLMATAPESVGAALKAEIERLEALSVRL